MSAPRACPSCQQRQRPRVTIGTSISNSLNGPLVNCRCSRLWRRAPSIRHRRLRGEPLIYRRTRFMSRYTFVLAALVSLAGLTSGGCRSCSSCHDYDPPVANSQYCPPSGCNGCGCSGGGSCGCSSCGDSGGASSSCSSGQCGCNSSGTTSAGTMPPTPVSSGPAYVSKSSLYQPPTNR